MMHRIVWVGQFLSLQAPYNSKQFICGTIPKPAKSKFKLRSHEISQDSSKSKFKLRFHKTVQDSDNTEVLNAAYHHFLKKKETGNMPCLLHKFESENNHDLKQMVQGVAELSD